MVWGSGLGSMGPILLLLLAARLAESAPLNFVVILVDDWGFGDLGANGFGAETPNLDQLASEGMRLTDMHSNSVCTPSRAALQTGRYNMRTGIHGAFPSHRRAAIAAHVPCAAAPTPRTQRFLNSQPAPSKII